MPIKIPHAETRRKRWYAVLDVPAEVRHIIGTGRLIQSTKTGDPTEAARRVSVLLAKWKADIAKARGQLPTARDTFWDSVPADHRRARETEGDDEGAAVGVVEDIIRAEAAKIADPEEASLRYRIATGQAAQRVALGPLVTAWKGSITKLAKKTQDQAGRDVQRMADHFQHLDALTPQKVKEWTDKQLAAGATASSFERIGNGCRSFWSYLQESGARAMLDPDPFVGPFRLAQRRAPATDTGRKGNSYTPAQVKALYLAAIAKDDRPLADLIALGAYTGARVEELCQITKETAKNGVFHIGTKTDASDRFLPIHPSIVPLVARMFDASKDGYLVPSNADNQYGNRSGPLSQRFGHLKKELKFGRAHVFHTMRGTLLTLLRHADVPAEVISTVAGHATKNFTFDNYTRGGSYAQQLAAISKVAYPAPLDSP
jgi:integrase